MEISNGPEKISLFSYVRPCNTFFQNIAVHQNTGTLKTVKNGVQQRT